MYCDQKKLEEIRNEIVGLEIKELYSDWANGIIYLRFANCIKTVMVAVKNNYFAGIDILQGICDGGDGTVDMGQCATFGVRSPDDLCSFGEPKEAQDG